ncbi:MAG: hypothetical protein KF729_39200 [Sandaracinaceae bacterium]|mgnify:CR=1 FL=1|nr:hypothetical protein [Sandaracinaceae bacterium]
MPKKLARVRELVTRHEAGRGSRYPAEVRREVVDYARRRRDEGASWAVIAGEAGLVLETLRRWCGSKELAARMVPVEVVEEESAPREVVIVSPSGFRLEGLDAASAVAALRALG